MSFALPREARLRHRRDFTRAQRIGTRQHHALFTVVVTPNDGGRARFGTAVSRRVGNAVLRNRLRRVLKEIFRHNAARLGPFDLLVIAKPELATLAPAGYAPIAEALLPTIDRALARERRRRPAEEGSA